MTIQEKVLGRVSETIENTGLEASVRPQWANTGTVDAVREFDLIFSYRYDFQDGYMSPSVSGPAVESLLDELGVQSRTYPTGATIEYVELDSKEYRVEDCRGMRGICLPLDTRKRYVKWYHLDYEGSQVESMLAFIERLATHASEKVSR